MPHLLLRGASVYIGHIAERLAVELSLPVFTTKVCRGWDSNIQLSACEANVLRGGLEPCCCCHRILFTFSSSSPEPLNVFQPNLAQNIFG